MYFSCICGEEGDVRVLLFHHLLKVLLRFSDYRSFASLRRFILRYFILFVEMVNGIVSLISLSALSLLEYRNARHFCGDFSSGTKVKNPPVNAGDMGLSPGPGRSHMLWRK